MKDFQHVPCIAATNGPLVPCLDDREYEAVT
jgi:hypothetical protein